MQRLIAKFIVINILIPIVLISPFKVFAQENSFVTIVNPQRISTYTKNYMDSFREEWSQIERRDLPATWLVTYDVLTKKDFTNDLKKLNDKQELGIFLEVTPHFAKAAGVSYNQTSSWHYATSLFLSGYTQENRRKLIDTVFKKFKETFEYYPVSVGGWWVDAYSLDYMKQKYGITGVLGVSDQYDLDNYAVWGTWWSVPYYPSKINAAVPAQSKQNKLDLVTFRWAARDPLNGYNNKTNVRHQPSLYSLQDYETINLPISYFQNLLTTYAVRSEGNRFGQATVGLEGDLSVSNYQNQYSEQLDVVKNLEDQGQVQVTTMKDFSAWYRKSFPHLSPKHTITSSDLLGNTSKRVVWTQTPFYRIGIETEANQTRILDLRYYYNNLEEPYYKEPNKQLNLAINLPFQVDSVILPNSVKSQSKSLKLPTSIQKYPVPPSGILYKDYSLTIPFTLKRRFPFLPSSIPFIIPQTFYISQTEYNALTVLKKLKSGNVLTFDKNCLKCTFLSQYKPSAASGNKSYISKYSGKKTDIDISFLLARSSAEARHILKDKNIRYIYLTHYEDYIESLPYLPQDLGLKKVYQNANAEIWEVK